MPGSTDAYYAKKVSEYIESVHTIVEISNKEALQAIKDVIWATETFDITTIRASTGQYLISKYISLLRMGSSHISTLLVSSRTFFRINVLPHPDVPHKKTFLPSSKHRFKLFISLSRSDNS